VVATAVADRVDTGAATTLTAMTQLNVCDASTEEKERSLNMLRMHATIK